MLAGSIVHTIVTEIKSKKAVPNTNQAVYNILAVDEQTGARYMVDVCVSLRLSNEGNAVLFCVDRIFVSYLEEARGRVVMEDLDGDGVLDGLRTEGRAYAPPFPYHSMEHGRRSGSSGLGTGAAWYSFVERDLSGEANPAGAARLNAGPFQELFRRVAVPALEELDFRPSERR
jgi:hypothetical protein